MEPAEELKHLEQLLLTPACRNDAAAVSALLAEEFREFGSSGTVYTKASIIDLLQQELPQDIAMKDFACSVITENVALVTYRSERATGADVTAALRSSLWVLRDRRWQMLFHQGTRVSA